MCLITNITLSKLCLVILKPPSYPIGCGNCEHSAQNIPHIVELISYTLFGCCAESGVCELYEHCAYFGMVFVLDVTAARSSRIFKN